MLNIFHIECYPKFCLAIYTVQGIRVNYPVHLQRNGPCGGRAIGQKMGESAKTKPTPLVPASS